MKVCNSPGCPNISPTSKCPDCTKTSNRRHWDDSKPYKTKGHQQFRRAVLHRDPLCALQCGRLSTIADHHPHSRKDLITLDLDPNDPRYGRGLCKPCHDSQTAANQPAGWNAQQEG